MRPKLFDDRLILGTIYLFYGLSVTADWVAICKGQS